MVVNDEMGDARKTPRERFLAVAERRTRTILKTLRLLGNCANRSYEYYPEEVNRIFSAIQAELDKARAKFDTEKNEIDFTLRMKSGEE